MYIMDAGLSVEEWFDLSGYKNRDFLPDTTGASLPGLPVYNLGKENTNQRVKDVSQFKVLNNSNKAKLPFFPVGLLPD